MISLCYDQPISHPDVPHYDLRESHWLDAQGDQRDLVFIEIEVICDFTLAQQCHITCHRNLTYATLFPDRLALLKRKRQAQQLSDYTALPKTSSTQDKKRRLVTR